VNALNRSSNLTLRPTGYSSSRADLSQWDHVYQYEVCGLPMGERASIVEMDRQQWQILRMKGDGEGRWTGHYKNPEEALAGIKAA
jgi:hypothetical protein